MQEDYRKKFAGTEHGPTGGVLLDLPSPYQAHPNGLLHLPRFLAKIRKHLDTSLPQSYQRNFTKGFDRFLCLHLGVEPETIIAIVKESTDDAEVDSKLAACLPRELKVHEWNRKMVQMGMSVMGREKLREVKEQMGVAHREDLLCFADLIDYDEGRIP
jgi:hypothetical protein